MEKYINSDTLKTMRQAFLEADNLRCTQNAVMVNGIKKSITNQDAIASRPFAFSIDVDSEAVMNQKKSGRCWMFAALNLIRFHINKKYNIKDMELSPDYLFFYDKLEKANYFYHNIIDTADKPLSNDVVRWLLQTPQQDGGDWNLVVSLIKKYGLVPKSVMNENAVSENTQEMDFMFNRKLQGDALTLRKMISQGALEEEISAKLDELNEQNYKLIAICLGTPPETFRYEYRDKDNNYHTTDELTPQQFFEEFVDFDIDQYVEIMNLPGGEYKFNQPYEVELSKNMVDGLTNRYLNLPMEDMKKLVIDQLKDGEPVWYGCDVLQEWNNPAGILALDVYDWKRSFGIEIVGDKTERFNYRESLPTHAMLISGVDIHDGKPTNWKIQNSWGDKLGHKGYFIMGDSWMDAYTYEVVVNKKYLTKEQQAAYEKEAIILPYWNAMNPI